MKITRRTEISAQTRELLVFRQRGNADGWCAECSAQVHMLSPQEAAAAFGVSLRQVFRQIEVGAHHFRETAEGQVFVCLNSVLDSRNQE